MLHLALAQLNMLVGDITGNVDRILRAQQQAKTADLLITPELAVCGYPPEDLLLRPHFLDQVDAGLERLAAATQGKSAMLVGTPWRDGGKVYNAAVLMADGQMQAVTAKHLLPNYGVFDEQRVFVAGGLPKPLAFKNHRLGVLICEDLWRAAPAKALKEQGADIILCLNASPFEQGKLQKRLDIAAARARETRLPVVYVNLIGGQDELVFDGRSFVLSATGQPEVYAKGWQEDVLPYAWQPLLG